MSIQIPLKSVEDLLLSITKSDVPLLSETSAHILSAGGKRLRPRLVLLAYEAVGGTNPDEAVPLAAAVEIIHTATLVHDDINDKGTLRRGRETVNSRLGGTFALLTGDFLFTKTYEIMAPYSEELNSVLAKAATELVEGETLQLYTAKRGELDRDTYYQVIAKKTAALFVASTQLGAIVAGAPEEHITALADYAFNLGMAFQITDDILDLIADPEQLGKNAGIDLSQGRGIAAAVGHGADRDGSSARTSDAVAVAPDVAPGPLAESLTGNGSLEFAIEQGRNKAREFIERGFASLDKLPESDAREELRKLGKLVLNRDH